MTTFRDAIIDRCREQGLPFSTEVLDIAAQLHEADVEELHGLAATEWLDDTTKLKAEVERLKGLLNRDHTGLAAGLNRCRQIGRGYFWIALGEWGSYDYTERTEQTLRMEIGNCLEEIEQTAVTALRESGVRAHAAFRPERDRIAVVERLLAGCEVA